MGKKKRKSDKNYLDYIPVVEKKWETLEDGLVEITVENTGFYNTLAQKLFKKPRFSFIKLDKYGSFVWRQIDGNTSIYEIGKILEKKHKEAGMQLYERLSAYFGILEENGYVSFRSDIKRMGRE
ncbi:MAG: PqqD family protein [Eubacteriales bacterium]|nr:PqqD family protein [Eubacteriales bacterium]